MAIVGTRISDLVPSEKILANRVDLLTRTTNELVTSGLAVGGPETNALMQGGPRKGSLPFIAPLATDEVNVTTDDITQDGSTGKITADEFGVLRHDLNYGWGYADLTRMITLYDVRGGIEAGVADYWNAQAKKIGVNSMKGALAATGAGSLTVGDGTTAFSLDMVIDAAATAEEDADSFNILILHPTTRALLQKAQKNAYVPASDTNVKFDTYAGYRVVVSTAFDAGVSVLARPGALAFDIGTVPYELAVEIERLSNKGNGGGAEIMHSRRSMVAHPQGFNYIGGVGVAPASLTDSAKWTLSIPTKQVPFRAIHHS